MGVAITTTPTCGGPASPSPAERRVTLARVAPSPHVGSAPRERAVPLPAALRPIIARRIDGRGRNELVFTGPNGGRLNTSNVRRTVDWEGVKTLLDRPDLRIHDLRQTLATLLLDAGAAVNDVKEILGHSSVQVTELYTRAREDSALRANSALDRLMGERLDEDVH